MSTVDQNSHLFPNQIKADLRDQELLSAMTDSVPAFISYVNHAHRYEFANKAYELFFGLSKQEIAGKHLRDVLGNRAYESIKENIDKALSGETVNAKVDLRTSSGELRHYEGAYTPDFDGDGFVRGITILQTDVTDRVHSQHQLLDRESQLKRALDAAQQSAIEVKISEQKAKVAQDKIRSLLDGMPQLIWTSTPQGDPIYANNQCLVYTGTDIADKANNGWVDAIHPEDADSTFLAWSNAMATGETFEAEYRLKKHTGEYRWFLGRAVALKDENGAIIDWLGTATDIHDRKLIEKRESIIQRKVAQLQITATELAKPHSPTQIARIVLNSIFQTVAPDSGCIALLEDEHFKVFDSRGYSSETLGLLENAKAEDLPVFEAIRNRRQVIVSNADELKAQYPEHAERFEQAGRHSVAIFPLIVEGRAIGVIALGFNVETRFSQERISFLTILSEQCAQTIERARLFEAEKSARRNAEMASRAKTQFLANMSHEIRTPMNAILGFSDLLGDQTITAEEREEYRKRIRANGTQLLHLIDDVLNLSRVEAGKLELSKAQLSVTDFITDVHASATIAIGDKGVSTPLVFDSNVPTHIESDPIRLRQIIMNLLSNASKFTHTGEIRTRVSFNPRSNIEDQRLIIDIDDTGIGMAERLQKKLFKPFSQGDSSITRRFGGAGLGLVLSRGLAAALGGTLELVRSAPGRGSLFRLSLPLEVPADVITSDFDLVNASSAKAQRESKETNNSLEGVRILLAEDSPDNEALIRAYLKQSGAEIDVARDGDQAIVRAPAGNYDVVLMDIQMPKTDGLQATRRLRELNYDRPILALSAHALPEEIERSLNSGCQAHLTKPVSRQVLISEIKKFVFKN